MSGEPVFRLFASCVPVRGAARSTLCDLQHARFELIPNGMHEILTEHRGRTVAEVKAAYGHQFDSVVDEYFDFLVERGFGFWTREPDAFPDLDLEWERPERITNSIVDVGPSSRHDFASIFRQLDDLGCKALQLRFFRACGVDEVSSILRHARAGRLRSVELLVPHAAEWDFAGVERLCAGHPRVSAVFVHSSPATAPARPTATGAHVFFMTDRVDSAWHCGQVHPDYFVAAMEPFTEALRYNSCLNRKMSVDEHGEIRNCPALPASFGNVANTSLHAALAHEEFEALWRINKDQIDVCRDCEFRYVCTDCRAFVSDDADRFSKPSRCAYDPYTAEWASGVPALHLAGIE
jgi:SPASM domain peptide maturase of grasp-with-spasm system